MKLATLVEDELKAHFSTATTPRCRGGHHSIPWIAPFYPWSLPYNAECYTRRHQVSFFESLVWLDQELNSNLPDHWWTLLIRPMVQLTNSVLTRNVNYYNLLFNNFIACWIKVQHLIGNSDVEMGISWLELTLPEYMSSSSCRAASTDIPDPLSPLLPIIHRLWQVFRVTSCVLT